MSVGISGARVLPPLAASGIVLPALEGLADATVFVTGAAVGVDAAAGQWLAGAYPSARHVVVVPSHRGQVDFWWELPHFAGRVEEVLMGPETTFADRNREIVDRVQVLYAFPSFPEHDPRSRRSGTWQTVRVARALRRDIHEHILNPGPDRPE